MCPIFTNLLDAQRSSITAHEKGEASSFCLATRKELCEVSVRCVPFYFAVFAHLNWVTRVYAKRYDC
jgi:hypothetical protein